nr:MAG TPA: hypothetical protein [Ackermannviridae sp.]
MFYGSFCPRFGPKFTMRRSCVLKREKCLSPWCGLEI